MARKHQAAALLNQGLSPSQIAKQMGISIDSVMGYLYNQVGEGEIRRSDILFTVGAETRRAVEEVERTHGRLARGEFQRAVKRSYAGVNAEEAWVYANLRQPEVYLGDMYWMICTVEDFLHHYIRETLERGYGSDWWRKGIPENIRVKCAEDHERDAEPAAEPYCYTTLVHLKDVFEKRWDLFSKLLPPGPSSDRKRFLSGLTKLNQIRNRVMHPSKGITPQEDDFRFVHEFLSFIDVATWAEYHEAQQTDDTASATRT
jgi:hypothetical protein